MTEKNLIDGTLALERKKTRVITIEAAEKPRTSSYGSQLMSVSALPQRINSIPLLRRTDIIPL